MYFIFFVNNKAETIWKPYKRTRRKNYYEIWNSAYLARYTCAESVEVHKGLQDLAEEDTHEGEAGTATHRCKQELKGISQGCWEKVVDMLVE